MTHDMPDDAGVTTMTSSLLPDIIPGMPDDTRSQWQRWLRQVASPGMTGYAGSHMTATRGTCDMFDDGIAIIICWLSLMAARCEHTAYPPTYPSSVKLVLTGGVFWERSSRGLSCLR
eukprot:3963361-Pyramimonas_sp.AAC.1